MKFTVTRTDGTDNSGKKYLVVNIDEPYAGLVADLIELCEREKGTWEYGDTSMREVVGICPFLDESEENKYWLKRLMELA